MITQLYTKSRWIVQFKWVKFVWCVNFISIKMLPNKNIQYEQLFGEPLSLPHTISFFFPLDFPPGSKVPVGEGLNLGFSLTVHVMIKVHSTFPVRISNQVFCSKCIYLCVLRPEKDFSPPWIDLRAGGAGKSVFFGFRYTAWGEEKGYIKYGTPQSPRTPGKRLGVLGGYSLTEKVSVSPALSLVLENSNLEP